MYSRRSLNKYPRKTRGRITMTDLARHVKALLPTDWDARTIYLHLKGHGIDCGSMEAGTKRVQSILNNLERS